MLEREVVGGGEGAKGGRSEERAAQCGGHLCAVANCANGC